MKLNFSKINETWYLKSLFQLNGIGLLTLLPIRKYSALLILLSLSPKVTILLVLPTLWFAYTSSSNRSK
jgi:hypothetical protein